MLKLVGCGLIFAGTIGCAIGVRSEVADHVRFLYRLKRLLVELSEDIRYSHQPMEQILLQKQTNTDERIAKLCVELGTKLAAGNVISASEEWENVFLKKRRELHLSQMEAELFAEAGRAFFGKCMEENGAHFAIVMDKLDFCIEEQRKEQREKQKVLQSVVMMGGAVLVLLLI